MSVCLGSGKQIGRIPSPLDEMQCQICGQVVGVIKPTPEEERKGLQAEHALHFRDEVQNFRERHDSTSG
jgi:hypothetical protein